MSAPDPVPVLCFRAGELSIAVAAESVAAIGPVTPGIPHIAFVLGARVQSDAPSRRTVHVAMAGVDAAFLVDGPVSLGLVDRAQVLALPRALPRLRDRAIVGFVLGGQGLVALVDFPRLVERSHRWTKALPAG
jgi:hypothetical protein